MKRRWNWDDFAFGGINSIVNLPGDDEYASVSRRDRAEDFRGWGCVAGVEFSSEAATRDDAKSGVEAKVNEILAAKIAA